MNASSDHHRIYATALLRALATGFVAVLLGIHLARTGLSTAEIGIVVSAGLAGSAVATLIATLAADRIGRRLLLSIVAAVCAAGGVALAFCETFPLALAAAFVGMVNGMGRDRAACMVIEQAILPTTVDDSGRTRAFAVYNVVQDVGHAVGGLMAALPALLRGATGIGDVTSIRIALVVYAIIYAALLPLYARLSPAVELVAERRVTISPQSRRILTRISALFAFDSLAGGFLTTALLSFFFFKRFGVSEAVVGVLFFGARIMNAFSHIGAAWLARRIGLVNTMVFTHIPSSLLLVTVAIAPNFPVACILFLIREGLVEMDVPTRQSYVMAVVRPDERSFASGITNLVRVGAWAVAPSFAGLFMAGGRMALPLVIGASMKVTYDIALWSAFRRVRPPEESAAPQ
jgi:MFS family permease